MTVPFSTAWTDAQLNALRLRADPAADELIGQLTLLYGPEQASALFRLLTQHLDIPWEHLPQLVQQFIETHQALPPWADPMKLARAEKVFLDHGPKFLVFLYYKSLPTLYACANGARVLVHSGRLAHDPDDMRTFIRRVGETGRFLLRVMGHQALSQADGKGIQAALKVRLIHASIRKFIPADHWQPDEWGQPINQEDLLVTLMTFSVSMFQAMERIGQPLEAADTEAFFHAWQVIGFCMGIEPEHIPADAIAGEALLQQILDRQTAASGAGQTLMQALLHFARESMPKDWFQGLPDLLILHLNDPVLAEMLGVKPHYYGCLTAFVPSLLMRWVGMIEKLEDLVPGNSSFNQYIDTISQRWALRMVDFFRDDHKGPLQMDATMTAAMRPETPPAEKLPD